MRHLVGAGHQRAMQEGRRRGREIRQVSPDIGQRIGADGQDLTIKRRAHLNRGDMVAPMRIGQKAFRPLRRPAHRAAKLFGGSQNQRLFAVVIDL